MVPPESERLIGSAVASVVPSYSLSKAVKSPEIVSVVCAETNVVNEEVINKIAINKSERVPFNCCDDVRVEVFFFILLANELITYR